MSEVFTRTAPGADAVYVHGLASTSLDWRPLLERVGGEALDLPGYGRSAPPADGSYSVAGHCRAVVRLLERRGGPAHLVGNSLGGIIAVRIAARRPDLVHSLTLLAPGFPGPRNLLRSALLAPLVHAAPLTGPLLRRIPAEVRVRSRYEHGFHGEHPDLAEAVAEQHRYDALPHSARAFLGTAAGVFRDWWSGGMWRDAARVTAPTLLLWGSHDRMIDPRLAVRAHRAFPRSRVVFLPRCGHLPQLECPAETAAAFRSFLADLPDRP